VDVKKSAKVIHTEIKKWRHELHKIPEIGFELFKTSQYIKERLDEIAIEYRDVAKTGIAAIINGEKPGPTIALRADMDALPIKEETGLPYASTNGYMHACGHDAHTAMLLGTAKILSKNKEILKGKVKLFFQPAEETTGGAKPMIEEGCMENPKVDAVLGLHINQIFRELGNGQIGIYYGAMMAAADTFVIKVIGKGGHGAKPHLCVDPITTAAEMITTLQRIISREINPTHPAVITVGKIEGGTTTNVIPEKVEFEGTVRTLDPDDRIYIKKRIREMCESIAKANRAEIEIHYSHSYPATINDRGFTRKFVKSAEKIVGKENIVEIKEPSMGADDMAYFLQEVPGTFFYLGSHNPKTTRLTYPIHHPKFDIDEDIMWIGSAVFAQTVLDFFNEY